MTQLGDKLVGSRWHQLLHRNLSISWRPVRLYSRGSRPQEDAMKYLMLINQPEARDWSDVPEE